MSNKRIPNLSVTDGFDFVKKIWGSLPIPSVMNPTTDLDELDKRISDLKAVEQWLNVNLSMLRATIQGLEVQRGTIATIKSFSSNLGLGGDRTSDVNQAVNEEIIRNAMQAAVAPPVPRVEPVAPKIPDPEPATTAPSDAATQESTKAIVSNATAWWGLLQDQFNKVVATAAMAGNGPDAGSKITEPAKKPVKPKAKRAATPRKKTASSTRPARTRT
ncbi:PhaM family polyhydroxyalkanoate granule multifunctional regulatory protein [Limnobacter alexandrii]|uniref:PhaM family polyhydroxyalkanoate granule multifunctional regulatory protein n=1 Tax=Limnobacter alexandrii TaxID=2570352 RepID=UPI0011094FC7|nr:PhaM family polyhydroxyalkanoate granule multifunctional regulatory protein [Limnobacter alexandrii]